MRSLLFVPGDSERKFARGLISGADVLILDLEDSVAADRKEAAREITRGFLDQGRATTGAPQLYVRVNSLDTALWEADLSAVISGAPAGIMLPKTRSGEDVHRMSIALHHAEQKVGIEGGTTRIVPIISEVPISILQMPTYIDCSTRVAALNWGMEDLSAELGAASTRGPDGQITSPFRLARDLTLYTSVAAGVAPLDAVYPDFRDLKGLEAECAAAARDGFTGKAAIHPDQVAVINAAFTPSAEEIERAEEIVRLFREAPGAGVVALRGQMVDKPHLVRAQRLLARARSATPTA